MYIKCSHHLISTGGGGDDPFDVMLTRCSRPALTCLVVGTLPQVIHAVQNSYNNINSHLRRLAYGSHKGHYRWGCATAKALAGFTLQAFQQSVVFRAEKNEHNRQYHLHSRRLQLQLCHTMSQGRQQIKKYVHMYIGDSNTSRVLNTHTQFLTI